jgi:hypothetical protein
LAELSLFSGYADTVSVDPNLHVVAHSKGGEEQFGLQTDHKDLRRNSEICSQNLRGLSNLNRNHVHP